MQVVKEVDSESTLEELRQLKDWPKMRLGIHYVQPDSTHIIQELKQRLEDEAQAQAWTRHREITPIPCHAAAT